MHGKELVVFTLVFLCTVCLVSSCNTANPPKVTITATIHSRKDGNRHSRSALSTYDEYDEYDLSEDQDFRSDSSEQRALDAAAVVMTMGMNPPSEDARPRDPSDDGAAPACPYANYDGQVAPSDEDATEVPDTRMVEEVDAMPGAEDMAASPELRDAAQTTAENAGSLPSQISRTEKASGKFTVVDYMRIR